MFVFVFVFLLIFVYGFSFLCLVDERSSAGFVFVFVFLLETGLCLADKRDLLLGLCLCSCWRSVCVLCSWIYVLVGSVFLCLCSCLLCFGFVFCVLGLCSWIYVLVVFVLVVLGSRSGSRFFFLKKF